MARIEMRLNRGAQIIDYLLEGGHNIADVQEEFEISNDTALRDMKLFANNGYGAELARNLKLYRMAVKEVEKENAKRRTKRG